MRCCKHTILNHFNFNSNLTLNIRIRINYTNDQIRSDQTQIRSNLNAYMHMGKI